jgi:hypothetical protein
VGLTLYWLTRAAVSGVVGLAGGQSKHIASGSQQVPLSHAVTWSPSHPKHTELGAVNSPGLRPGEGQE